MAEPALKNVSPIRPDLQVVEQRVADLDDGYVRLATMILEEIAGADFTKRQFKVILAVIRLTYGWNKARDRIANSQISEIAKLPIKRVSETRVQLLKMNVLTAIGHQIGLNKNISEWCIPQNEGVSLKTGDKKSLKLGDSYPSKQGDTIDIIPKTIKTTNTPIVPLSVPDKPVKETKRATQYPNGFSPNDGNRDLAKRLDVNLESEFEAFSDHHRSKGSTFKDWNLALNTWLRNAVKFGGKTYQRKTATVSSKAVSDNFSSKNYGHTDVPLWAED